MIPLTRWKPLPPGSFRQLGDWSIILLDTRITLFGRQYRIKDVATGNVMVSPAWMLRAIERFSNS